MLPYRVIYLRTLLGFLLEAYVYVFVCTFMCFVPKFDILTTISL